MLGGGTKCQGQVMHTLRPLTGSGGIVYNSFIQ